MSRTTTFNKKSADCPVTIKHSNTSGSAVTEASKFSNRSGVCRSILIPIMAVRFNPNAALFNSVTCLSIIPDSSSRLTRREQGVGDKPMLSANSKLLMRALPCISCNICLSIRSNFTIDCMVISQCVFNHYVSFYM